MQNWYDRFKEIREKHKLSQAEIGRAIGKDGTQVSRYERGVVKGFPNGLYKLLKDVFSESEIEYIEKGDNNIVSDIPLVYGNNKGMVTLPYHKEVYASAGGGSDATDMTDTSPVTFSTTFLNSFLGIRNFKGLSIINAAGDSMKPTINSGALMFVYPMENEGFKDGGIYVLMCGDALLVKRVYLDPVNAQYTLHSDNDNVADTTLSMDESSECRFIGRVVGHLDRA